MIVKYFKDTDTVLLELTDAPVDETREISDDVIVDFDKDGNVVSITIEHAAAPAQFTIEGSGGLEIRPPTRRLGDIVLPPAPEHAVDSLKVVEALRQQHR